MSTWPDNEPFEADPQADPTQSERIQRAIDAFIAAKFPVGDTILKSWFYQSLHLEFPADTLAHADANKLELRFLAHFQPLRMRLLREYKIALATNNAGGYTVVPPGEQATWAQDELNGDLRSAFKKGRDRAYFANTDSMTDAQRNERRAILMDIQKRAENAGSKLRRHQRYADAFADKDKV